MRQLPTSALPQLTDDGRACLLLFFFSLLAAYNTGTNLIFLLSATLLASLIVSVIAAKVAVRDIRAKVTAPPMAGEEERVNVTVVLHNTGSWAARFLRIRVHFLSNEGMSSRHVGHEHVNVPILHPGEEKRTTVAIEFPMRGSYHLQWVSLESTFPLGLMTYPRQEFEHEVTTVVPPSLLDKAFQGVSSHEQESDHEDTKTYKRGEGMTFYGLRKYIFGDPMKSVHWKSTARTGQLMVQEYQTNLTARYYVYLDLERAKLIGKGRDSNLERSIRLCATLCHQLSRENNLTQVLIYQDDVKLSPPIFTSSDAYLMLNFLGGVNYTSHSSLARLVNRTLPAIIPNSFLVFILVDMDEETIAQMVEASRPGQGCIAIFNLETKKKVDELSEGPLAKDLKRKGIHPLFVCPSTDNKREILAEQ